MNKVNFDEIKKNVLEKLESLDDKQRYMIFVGVLLAFFLLDYLLLMRPQLNGLFKLNSNISVITQQLSEARDNISKHGYYKSEIERLEKEVDASNERIKSKEKVDTILQLISTLADQNGVRIDQVIPNTNDQRLLLENNQRNYLSIPIFIQARSNYHNFGRFLNDLESSDIHVDVESFSITTGDEQKEHKILVTLNAVMYEEKKEGANKS